MIEDIRKGEIDAGVLWGPIAGYFASRGGEELVVKPLLKDRRARGWRIASRLACATARTSGSGS